MAKVILAFPNEIDATFYSVAFSGGSWETNLPLTNLADPLLSATARSTSASLSSTKFTVDLGVSRSIKILAIPEHNMGRLSKWRVIAASDAAFSNIVYQTAWEDVWPIVYPFGSLPFGHPGWWDQKLSEEEATDQKIPLIHVLTNAIQARYWTFEFDDVNNTDGYVDLSRLFLAPGYQPSRNMSYGAGIGWQDETTVERSLGGVRFYDQQDKRRSARFVLDALPTDEGLTRAFEMQRRLGISGQIMYVFDPDDTVHLHRRSFLATMRELDALEFPFFAHNSIAFDLLEVL